MQRSAWRPTRSASVAVRPLSTSTRWNACGPSPGVTPDHTDVYGFIRSAVDERGSSCRNTSRSGPGRHDLLQAHHGDQRLRQRQAHPAVALGLDHHDRPGVGDREVRAGDADLRGQELAPQVHPRRLGQVRRPVGHVARVRHRGAEDVADLRAVAVDRRHQDVRRPVVAELHDQLREVGLDGRDAAGLERLVQPDLRGGHRLDLDDLARARGADEAEHDLVGLRASRAQCTCPPRAVTEASSRVR